MPSAVVITPRPIYIEDMDIGTGTVAQTVMNAGTVNLTRVSLSSLNAGLPVFHSNAAAVAGGLTSNDLYQSGGNPSVVCVVL
jgi:hypothetical protein